jgi:hypothetical protein
MSVLEVCCQAKIGGDRYVKIEGFKLLKFCYQTDILTTAFVTMITTVNRKRRYGGWQEDASAKVAAVKKGAEF